MTYQPHAFDQGAYDRGEKGTATRFICERPRFDVGCGTCKSCRDALARADRERRL